jgi:methylenetetrahydrofolate reductase (NADPH)
MRQKSRLEERLEGSEFVFTAEYSPSAGTDLSKIEACAGYFHNGITAVNVADNHYGVALSSLAASVALSRAGIEPIYQVVTRDRNRIAMQSDLLGAALLGIKNVLCLSGYHQTLIGCPESANVFDIDSIQLIALVTKMNGGQLLDGNKIDGDFAMLAGAAANPYLKPRELNMLRLSKKIKAGAAFIQTQAVFDVPAFKQWLEAAGKQGLTGKAAILAGVMPLQSAAQAKELAETHTDFYIPDAVHARLLAAGDAAAQRQEGLKIAVEIIRQLKGLPGLKGIHLLSGGHENAVPELLAAVV